MIQCDQCYAIWPDDYDATHCDCGAEIDEHCAEIACAACNVTMSLDDECEWPPRRLYCWGCAHEKLTEAESLLGRIDDAYDKPSWSDRETANTVMDSINDWLGDNRVLQSR